MHPTRPYFSLALAASLPARADEQMEALFKRHGVTLRSVRRARHERD